MIFRASFPLVPPRSLLPDLVGPEHGDDDIEARREDQADRQEHLRGVAILNKRELWAPQFNETQSSHSFINC